MTWLQSCQVGRSVQLWRRSRRRQQREKKKKKKVTEVPGDRRAFTESDLNASQCVFVKKRHE